jgi:glucosyl-3-phosphoglycerate synthase
MAEQALYPNQKGHRESKDGKISVIIPVLNESRTIRSVVEFARRGARVSEVIVVDDGSIDGSPEMAAEAGARVITSRILGKGASMEDGAAVANNEVLLYLDGDLSGLAPDLIERLSEPILLDKADFVKARFTRNAGRVSLLTARPLLRTYFPELMRFEQPLGGIIAVRRSLAQKLRLEDDYGVDIGLLIDAFMSKARLEEIDIGHIEHDSKPLAVLEDMAIQVARTIVDRAALYGRLRSSFVRRVQESQGHQKTDLIISLQKRPRADRLALLDMDGVILDGRFIVELAARTQRQAPLVEFLDRFDLSLEERTRKIGAVFAGVAREVFDTVAREMPLMAGAVETVVGLRKAGFCVGIVTNSFHIASEIVRRRVFADFSLGNLIKFRNGQATGRVMLAPELVHTQGCEDHKYCKANVLLHVIQKLGILKQRVLAIGDGENDICMLRQAGSSVAFQPKSPAVRRAAQHLLTGALSDVLAVLDLTRRTEDPVWDI